MADCECLTRCPFFNGKVAGMFPSTVEMMKQRLCRGDPSECARYMVFKRLGREAVPADLLPNQAERARALLE